MIKDPTPRPRAAVVDDDLSFREAICGLLSLLGLDVTPYSSAESILDEDDLSRYGVFLLDIQMPGLSGFDLQDRLQARGVRAPVIFISSQTDDATRDRAESSSALALLGKPFQSDELIALLKTALPPDWRPE